MDDSKRGFFIAFEHVGVEIGGKAVGGSDVERVDEGASEPPASFLGQGLDEFKEETTMQGLRDDLVQRELNRSGAARCNTRGEISVKGPPEIGSLELEIVGL